MVGCKSNYLIANFWDLERYTDKVALVSDGVEFTYADLAKRADARLNFLPGPNIFALECANNIDAVEVYLGALRKGIVPLLVDSGLDPELKNGIYDKFSVGHIFDASKNSWSVRRHGFNNNCNSKLKLLMSTSGSTGSPKLVRLSGDNLSSNSRSIANYLGLSSEDVAITSLPLHYSYGLSILNSYLAVGARVVLTDEAITTQAFWSIFRDNNVTSLSGVPMTWRILRRMKFERMSLPSLKTLTQAGGKLETEEVKWLASVSENWGCQFYVMYGQTEATARIAYLPANLVSSRAGSIGIAIPGGNLQIIDSNGVNLPANMEGQLVYQGPNVMMGYAFEPNDLLRDAELNNLHTGDLGYRDEEGLYWITGRLSRFIKIFGNRFSLDEVENALIKSGHEVAVVGDDDSLMIALVGSVDQASQLRKEIADRYKIHVTAVKVMSIDSLPRNSAGKMLYSDLTKYMKLIQG